ncbi:MAG: hypothetical protein BWX86_02472 [Verrucomicrobia bacterium ADurb.Bin122]|nr:MAG: hypothetical protein BWX86_02472 [Verrucomicrobia bacterium ADurb.Bin122]
MQGEREKDAELVVVWEEGARGAQRFHCARGFANGAQGGAEPEECGGVIVGREAEGEGFFVVGDGFAGAVEDLAGPGELEIDLGDVGVALVELAEALDQGGAGSAVAGSDDRIEFAFPRGQGGGGEIGGHGAIVAWNRRWLKPTYSAWWCQGTKKPHGGRAAGAKTRERGFRRFEAPERWPWRWARAWPWPVARHRRTRRSTRHPCSRGRRGTPGRV